MYASDIVIQATIARESATIAQKILSGEYTYSSLLQGCLQYIYTYQCLPTFFTSIDIERSEA